MKTGTGKRRSGPPVTASVIAWNDRAHLVRCLAALRAQTHGPIRIVVVDNASRDGSAAAALAACPEAAILRNDQNLGYAGAHNRSFALAEDPYFLVLNADVRLAPDYVARLVAALERDEGLGSASGKLLRASAEEESGAAPLIDSAGIGLDWRGRFRDLNTGLPDEDGRCGGDVFGVCGAAAIYRRAAIVDAVPEEGVGGRPFDIAFFAYYEDADLAWALRRRGWRAMVEAGAIARHVRGGSAGGGRQVERLLHRNALWVLAKHAGPGDLLRIAPGWLLYESGKVLQALTAKPWLLRAQVERLTGLRAMAGRRRALRVNERRAPKRTYKRTPGALQAMEMNLRDAQAPAYDALTGGPYHEAVESAACLERLAACRGERILDLGCGTGRLLPPLVARGARVFGADFSLASLKIARKKAPGAVLVQADLMRLPFKPGAFDRAVSHQVLQHLPDVQGRREVLGEAARVLRKEGEIVLTCYNDALLKQLRSPREGRHRGGIFYHRFRPGELRRLFEARFEIIENTGIRHIPARSVGERLFTRRGFRWLPALDRRLEGTSVSRFLAHLWLVHARVRAAAEDAGDGEREGRP